MGHILKNSSWSNTQALEDCVVLNSREQLIDLECHAVLTSTSCHMVSVSNSPPLASVFREKQSSYMLYAAQAHSFY